MHPKFNKRDYFLLFVTLTLIPYIPSSLSQNRSDYETCRAPFQCANIQNVTYPFWSDTRPSYCGLGGFQLDCQGEVPILTFSSIRYRVLEIDSNRKTLRVARQDLFNTVCPTALFNTTLDFNLFRPSDGDRNITLYYGCSPIDTGFPHTFPCNEDNISLYVTGDATLPPGFGITIICRNSIYVPINQTAAMTLEAISTVSVSILQGVFASGFSLQWEANNRICENCVNSGGICGTRRDSDSFACYCANGTSPSTCNYSQTQEVLRLPAVVNPPHSFLSIRNITYPFTGDRPANCSLLEFLRDNTITDFTRNLVTHLLLLLDRSHKKNHDFIPFDDEWTGNEVLNLIHAAIHSPWA